MTGGAALAAMTANLGIALAGAWLLRRAWSARTGKAPWRWAGLLLLACNMLWPAWILGPARGPFIAVTLLAIAALGMIASGYSYRRARTGRTARAGLAPEPAARAPSAWRTALRWSLAGPVGMIAAMAIGVSYSVWAPGEMQTRLLIGGLLVPLAWGGAMAWTLVDSRILRATAVLAGTAIIGFGAAMFRGFA
ncbi:hypothetical protein [Blastomonas sp. SL216]|uniref:hypothetical protein n=1 Tax=Blastomonas sp. SL216 TaxID=2995169 RepID=UPI002377984F|nr:hypothetical protein OU999_14005 [Blastomonas sp. SL216]